MKRKRYWPAVRSFLIYVGALLVLVETLAPMAWMVISSLSPAVELLLFAAALDSAGTDLRSLPVNGIIRGSRLPRFDRRRAGRGFPPGAAQQHRSAGGLQHLASAD
jgi:ABC-type glycerol-3-phosphate transport system permease component